MGISLRGKEGIQISICFHDFLKGKEKRKVVSFFGRVAIITFLKEELQ